jgi:hypothetical protein
MSGLNQLSRRDNIRYEAARVLKEAGAALHFEELAARVKSSVNIEDFKAKDLNTSLHDDPQGRFHRVGRGTWVLNADFKRSPRWL